MSPNTYGSMNTQLEAIETHDENLITEDGNDVMVFKNA
jgi:hypothetical protein